MSTNPASDNDYLHSFPEEQVPSAADIAQPIGTEELVQQIKDTADKLLRDKANRGDVKLLSTALRELRYAFKVFAPVRNRRKVTVFGSARLGPDHPAYKQADQFIRKQMLARGMISLADTSLYKVTDSVSEAVAEIANFYRVYHSLRYVHGDLVLRLQRAPTALLLDRIRADFKDILAGGT